MFSEICTIERYKIIQIHATIKFDKNNKRRNIINRTSSFLMQPKLTVDGR